MVKRISCLFFAILITLTAMHQAFCEEMMVFGPENFKTSKWHFTLNRETFSVDDPGDGVITVIKTDPENVPEGGFLIFNYRLIPLGDFFKSSDLVFKKDVPLKSNNLMIIFFRGTPETPIQISVSNGSVPIPPPEVNVAADPLSIMIGETSTLIWETSHADNVSIDNGIGAVDLNGSMLITPDETITYEITATGPGGTASSSTLLTVLTPPEVTILEPDGVDDTADDSFTITWTDEDPDSNATIALYYDMDGTGTDGILIAEGIAEDPDDAGDHFQWDTSAIAQGDYYIYAVIDDGVTPATTAYSPGPVIVSHNTPPQITIDLVEEHINPQTYEYIDSRSPGGPVYSWIDITGNGTELELSNDDSVEVLLPFDFSFYGENKKTMRISSNGYLTFGSDGDSWSNRSIPDPFTPNDIIALCWEDLNPIYGGMAHYYHNPIENYYVVQYTGIMAASYPLLRTFQGILYPSGDILIQYKDIQDYSPGTVGVENSDGTEGLQIAYNSPFIENELAVLIKEASNKTVIQWTDDAPDSNALISIYYDTDNSGADGVLIAEGISEDPDGTGDQFMWDTSDIPEGTYYIYIVIDDGVHEPVISYYNELVAINFDTLHFTSATEHEVIEGEEMTFSVQAIDPDGDPLTYSASNLPEGATFNPATREFSWITPGGQTGEFYPVFTVTDGENIATQIVAITVIPHLPLVAIRAEPSTILYGEASILTWTSTGADTCSIEPGIGDVTVNGSIAVTPAETSNYTITVAGPDGTRSVSLLVTVLNPSTPPEVSISADPESVSSGGSAILSWASVNAESIYIDNDIGPVSNNGSISVSPQHTTVFTINAIGPGGSASANMTLRVLGDPAPLPEGSFGKQYEDLVPPDATVDFYDEKRFSIITGLVENIDENPIQDVDVKIQNHPEYGMTKTDAEGRFSIPVEGGRTIMVQYNKQGLISSQRKVYVPWNDIAIAETIRMIVEDPVSTIIVFDGNPDSIIAHQSTDITDEFGTRSCTMVFKGDNQAHLVDENGNKINELETITTRATEYTTPESMPAELPPTSAYTYCVEMSVDGAERVRFEKPVTSYVDNFLGFDVGEIVPVGSYDRDRGVWIPEANGVVVELLDTDLDGVVDALDADGDSQPDDLDGSGSVSDEVIGLDDPVSYPPGNTFWRFEVTHFTPWDCNWPYGPPMDATRPEPEGIPNNDQQGDEPCNTPCGSHIDDRGRILHEDIPIPGTDITLHYAGNRDEGYKTGFNVPVSGESVSPSVKRILVRVTVAGRVLEQALSPLPSQDAIFAWDGLDYLGRQAMSPVTAHIETGYEYDVVYYRSSADFYSAFGQAGSGATGREGRNEMSIWKEDYIDINFYPEKSNTISSGITKGWTISSRHHLNLGDLSTLHKGDGTKIINNLSLIDTIAGGNSSGYTGDGGLAIEATLGSPRGVAFDAYGNMVFADGGNDCIRMIDTEGIITTIAGTGVEGYSGDGGPAVEAEFNLPRSIAIDSNGNIYIGDNGNDCIRRIDTSGIITTVAGTGVAGYSGDGGPAIEAMFNSPQGLAVDEYGNLFVSDWGNARIRKIDTNGIITTIAGTGVEGYSGDGGPAVEATLYRPFGIALDTHGNLFVAGNGNYCIRKIDTSGIITTFAGTGERGYSGDGGPATEAMISTPLGIAVDTLGNLFMADYTNYCIRKIDTSGVITTIAGNGEIGYSGDGGPAVEAQVYAVDSIAVDANGDLFFSDSDLHGGDKRIRRIGPSVFSSQTVTGGEIPFADENGLGYIMGNTGLHNRTIDLDTGNVLNTFMYATFDGKEQLAAITDQFGNQITINRYPDGTPYSITSPDGLETQLTIDVDGYLTDITYPDTSSYNFSYSTDGMLTEKIEPNANRFNYKYDENGRVTDTYDENEGHWHFERVVDSDGIIHNTVTTGENNVTTYQDFTDSTPKYTSLITGPEGGETNFTRSADGLSVQKNLPCGMELDFSYDADPQYKFKYVEKMTESTPTGLVKTTQNNTFYNDTDADDVPDLIIRAVTVNDKTTTFEHDILSAQKITTSPEGRAITSSYDPTNLLTTSISKPGFFDTTYGYDGRGRVTSILTNTRETLFAYDGLGNLETTTDPEGYTTTYGYDAMGRVTNVYRPDTSDLSYSYDDNGNMTIITKPSDISHDFGFNTVNMMDTYQTPLSGNYSYFYDKDRRLISKTFPSGKQIIHTYSPALLDQTQTPEGTIDYTYLCGSKIGSITKGTESISYGYDGKLITDETIGGTINQTLSYAFNNNFNLDTFTYAGGTESFAYDDDNLLIGAGDFTITRNVQNGLPESLSGGALIMDSIFNGYGEIGDQDITVNGQTLSSWTVTRDNNGRITDKTETLDGATSTYAYEYDTMGRLVSVTKDGILIEEYAYNLNGSREYEMNSLRGIAGRSMNYSDEDHLLTAGEANYQYDLDGFLLSKTEGADIASYTYSSRGELLSAILPDNTLIEYVHDPLGRRIAKKVNGAVREKYLWKGLTRLLAVYDGSDNLLQRFEYAEGRMPVAMTQGGATYYLSYDQVGSLRLVADASGSVVKKIEYDTFGSIISDTDPSFTIPYGFAGGLHDADTGLVRFGYRDYDPDIGRWTAKDPILFAGGDSDLYGYCLNDPVNCVDPWGLLNNPITNYPSFSAAFPNSNAAAVADIIVGGIEAGAAVALGVTAVITTVAGPELWVIAAPLGGITAMTAYDAYSRIAGGVGSLTWNARQNARQELQENRPCP